MHRLVLDIIEATEEEIEAAFENIPANQVARVERYLKFMLHPDRNGHHMATDAFQKLSNSKWKLKFSKLLSNSCYCKLPFFTMTAPVDTCPTVAAA